MAIDKVTTAAIADDAVTNAKVSYNNNQFRNIMINGDMSIAQRSTSVSSITGSGYNTVDRIHLLLNSLGTWTQSQSTTVPTGQGFATSLKMDNTTADASPSSGDYCIVRTKFEGQMLQYLKKGTSSAESLTLSFWVRSNKTGTYIAELYDADNTRSISKSYTISSADTWEKKTITYDGDTTGTLGNDNLLSLSINFWLGAGTNYTSGTLATSWASATNANRAVGQVNLADSTSNEWYVTGVQLEAGTSASDFEFLPVDVNLNRCKRYFQLVMRGTGSDQPICNGSQHTSSAFYAVTKLDGSMRTAPTMSSSTGTNVYEVIGNSTSTFHSSIDGFQNLSNVFSMRFRIYMNSSGTQGHARWLRMTASADSTKSITASAEL